MEATLTCLGPYDLCRVLGRGGMGVVYVGRHRIHGGAAAVKTAPGADPVRLSQIRREIHALARLRHPGVIRILDHGVTDGRPWYAMDLLHGATVRDVFRGYWRESASGRHPIGDTGSGDRTTSSTLPTLLPDSTSRSPTVPPPTVPPTGPVRRVAPGRLAPAAGGRLIETLTLVRRLCDALAYVHGEGVVHRDIKPGNIFVRDSGRPVLVDFGLTSNAGGTAGREVIEAPDRVAGSAAYMAPEQLRGEPLDARCDLYALGCVLYELVTGDPPVVASRRGLGGSTHNAGPPPPSALVEGVMDGLDDLLARLLAPDRDQRIGYAEDVARELERLGAGPSAWGAALPPTRRYLYRPTFIGRHDILSRLTQCLPVPGQGQGRLVLVGAESGAGKTRLALALSNRARQTGTQVASGDCIEVTGGAAGEGGLRGTPLDPLRALMESIQDLCLAGGAAMTQRLLGERLAILSPYFPALAQVPGGDAYPPPPPLPPEAARHRLFNALEQTLAAVAGLAPLLLVLDDLQWADELTLGLLAHLAVADLADRPLLILGTYRSDEVSARLAAVIAEPRCLTLRLEQMTRAEVGLMAEAMLAWHNPPARLIDFLFDRSAGNPFFVAEYLRAAVTERVLTRDGRGFWQIETNADVTAAALVALPLPESLARMVDLRLGRIPLSCRQVLDAAAIMGRVVDLEVLGDLMSLDEREVFDALDELVRCQVLEPGRDGGFRFTHDKLREIPAERLGPDARCAWHRRIAQALEDRYRGQSAIESRHTSLGLHWSRGQVPERAAPELMIAGDRARQFNAVYDAIDLYQATLEQIRLVEAKAPPNLDLYHAQAMRVGEQLGDALALTGQRGAAREAFATADGRTPAGAGVVRARLKRKAGKTWEIEHRHTEALADYTEADRFLERVSPDARDIEWHRERSHVGLNRIWAYYWQGDVDGMNRELTRVQPLVLEHGLPLHRYLFHTAAVLRDCRRDRYRISEQTVASARLALAAARESALATEVSYALFALGFCLLFDNQLDEAQDLQSQARDSSRLIGDANGEARALAYLTLCRRRLGQVEPVREGARELERMTKSLEMNDYLGLAQALLAWVDYRQGHDTGARTRAEQALSTWESLSFQYPLQWTAVLILLRLGLPARPLDQLVRLARFLCQPEQAQLPAPIDAPLGDAVAYADTGAWERVPQALADALAAAEGLGLL